MLPQPEIETEVPCSAPPIIEIPEPRPIVEPAILPCQRRDALPLAVYLCGRSGKNWLLREYPLGLAGRQQWDRWYGDSVSAWQNAVGWGVLQRLNFG